jgi:DNA primase
VTQTFTQSREAQLRQRIITVNRLAADFYHYILTAHPLGAKAREYLAKRLITNNSITYFSLGYAPNSWDSLAKFLAKKNYSPADLETAGLVSKSAIGRHFDRFRGRLMFPLADQRGNILGFAGRLLDPEAKEAKYVNTAETAVYIKGNLLYGLHLTKDAIKKEGAAVIVEGEIDTIQAYQAGTHNIVAIKGTALTEGQINLLKRYTENISLALDADLAGDAAARRGIQLADQAGLNIRVVTFADAKDPDELIKKDPLLWHQAVKHAVPFYDYIIDSTLAKHDLKNPTEAKKIVQETAPFLVPIDNLIIKNHYLKKLAGKLDIAVEALEEQLNREHKRASLPATGYQPPATSHQPRATSPKSRPALLEEYLLSLLLQSPHPSDYLLLISHRLSPDDFTAPALGNIYQNLLAAAENQEVFNINAFVRALPPELTAMADRLFLLENRLETSGEEAILEEVRRTAWEIKELSLREKLRLLSRAIKEQSEPEETVLSQFAQVSATLQKLRDDRETVTQKS